MQSTHVEGPLSVALTNEHHRLDSLWSEVRTNLENDISAERIARLQVFKKELRRHILDEEMTLFPDFEERTGMSGSGPTAVMRSEHRQLEALIEELIKTLGPHGDTAQAIEQANALSFLMDSHDKKEERILYPMMDRAFGEQKSSALLAKISLSRRDS